MSSQVQEVNVLGLALVSDDMMRPMAVQQAKPNTQRTPPLPNFFIVGVARAGTTSLARYLETHPQVFIPLRKEIDFFDREDNWQRGPDWYRSQFAEAAGKLAIGDPSPGYMYVPHAIPRMASVLPDAKLIVLLRNPVDRAYSNYWMRRSWKVEGREFRTAIEDELDGRGRDPEYVARGMYCAQLKHISKYFPRSSLHVSLFEDLRRDPGAVFVEVCNFIGVDPTFTPPNLGLIHNINYRFKSVRLWWWLNRWRQREGVLRQLVLAIDRFNLTPFHYPPMDPATRAALLKWFREPNRQLEEWLGSKLPEWQV